MSNSATKILTTATMVSSIALFAGQAFAQAAVDDTARGKATANSQGIASIEDRVGGLEGRVGALEGITGDLQSQITTEVGKRVAGDAGLQGQITTEVGNRQAADNALDGRITTEVNQRNHADNVLTAKVATEVQDRQSADGALAATITTEIGYRNAGDAALQTQIDNIELQKGDKGDTGDQGEPGVPGASSTVTAGDIADLQEQIYDLVEDLSTNTVFVTSSLHNGNLGGAQATDEICNIKANEGGLTGNYRAWISTFPVTGDPQSRMTHSGRAYVRTDGITVAENWSDLTDGDLSAPINVDQNGNSIAGAVNPFVWTASSPQGHITFNDVLIDFDQFDGNSVDDFLGYLSSFGGFDYGLLDYCNGDYLNNFSKEGFRLA